MCWDDCSCKGCKNNEANSAIRKKAIADVLQRRPDAFEPRNKKGDIDEGCRCKKSKCLKKYCLCYSAGEYCDRSKCRCRDVSFPSLSPSFPLLFHWNH